MAHTKQRAAHEAKRGLAEWQRRVAVDIAAAFPLVAVAPIRASGNHLASQNDEPEPMECGDLTPEEIDAAYHLKKVGGGLRRRDDRSAADADLAWLDVLRRSEAL